MDHRPYPKIPKRHDGSAPAPGGIWVATEKIHGANLVVATDGAVVRVGKRKAFLEHDDPFFGWQLLRADLERAALGVHGALGGVVRLYGEIFGGAYPHPSVPAVKGMSAVQSGIWYAPDIHFALFDIVVGDDFLAHSEVEKLAEAHGLFVVPLLGRGARSDLESLPVRFPSRVAPLLDLPALAGNFAEGFVLKPDARARVDERYVTKWKIREFDEARFDEATAFDADDADLFTLATRLVNDARLASARSKVGTNADAIAEEVILDVLVDLEAAFPRAFATLDASAEERLRAHISSLIARG